MLFHIWGLSATTSSHFHLLPKLKAGVRDQNFSSYEDVKAAVREWFREKGKDFLKAQIETC
jgi:hypothetical protein